MLDQVVDCGNRGDSGGFLPTLAGSRNISAVPEVKNKIETVISTEVLKVDFKGTCKGHLERSFGKVISKGNLKGK